MSKEKIVLHPAKKSKLLYAIQRPSDKKYSRGGTGPGWGPFPKTWSQGAFKNHLLMFFPTVYRFNLTVKAYKCYYENPSEYGRYKLISNDWPYWDCEIVAFDIDSLEIQSRYPAHEWVWENCYKPYLDKEIKPPYDKYKEPLLEFCEKVGVVYE